MIVKLHLRLPMVIKRFSLLFFLCAFYGLAFAQDNYNTLLYRGNQKFYGKDYNAAANNFLGAAKLNPNDFGAHYNLGNSYYKRKMYKEAEAEYAKAEALSKNNGDRAAALYNRGNAQMQAGNQEKAAEFYKKSLKINPYDEATRKNFEIAMLKEKEKNQSQSDKNKSGGGGNDKNKNQDKQGNNSRQQSGGNQQQNQGQGQGNEGRQNQENSAGSMPKDQQNAILNRVGNKERETAKRILNKNGYSNPESNQKDW